MCHKHLFLFRFEASLSTTQTSKMLKYQVSSSVSNVSLQETPYLPMGKYTHTSTQMPAHMHAPWDMPCHSSFHLFFQLKHSGFTTTSHKQKLPHEAQVPLESRKPQGPASLDFKCHPRSTRYFSSQLATQTPNASGTRRQSSPKAKNTEELPKRK